MHWCVCVGGGEAVFLKPFPDRTSSAHHLRLAEEVTARCLEETPLGPSDRVLEFRGPEICNPSGWNGKSLGSRTEARVARSLGGASRCSIQRRCGKEEEWMLWGGRGQGARPACPRG